MPHLPPPDSSGPKISGGSGGPRNRHQLADQRLVARALKQSWPVSEKLKKAAMKRAKQTLADPQASPRSVSAATRMVLSATQTNLQAIDMALRCRLQEELVVEVEELKSWRESCEGGQTPSIGRCRPLTCHHNHVVAGTLWKVVG